MIFNEITSLILKLNPCKDDLAFIDKDNIKKLLNIIDDGN
jgi:hypothetical protein